MYAAPAENSDASIVPVRSRLVPPAHRSSPDNALKYDKNSHIIFFLLLTKFIMFYRNAAKPEDQTVLPVGGRASGA
jgi:hypothetical protein